jgi:hypothetical protein
VRAPWAVARLFVLVLPLGAGALDPEEGPMLHSKKGSLDRGSPIGTFRMIVGTFSQRDEGGDR